MGQVSHKLGIRKPFKSLDFEVIINHLDFIWCHYLLWFIGYTYLLLNIFSSIEGKTLPMLCKAGWAARWEPLSICLSLHHSTSFHISTYGNCICPWTSSKFIMLFRILQVSANSPLHQNRKFPGNTPTNAKPSPTVRNNKYLWWVKFCFPLLEFIRYQWHLQNKQNYWTISNKLSTLIIKDKNTCECLGFGK